MFGETDKYEARVTPHLPPGERYVAAAQVTQGPHPDVSFRYRVIVVTDRRIHVYSAKLFRVCAPKELLRSFEPGTPLVVNSWKFFNYSVLVGSQQFWAKRAWRKQLDRLVEASQSWHRPQLY